MNNRWKNYGLWVAIAALGGMAIQDAGINLAPERYEMYVDYVLTALIAAGIISSPTSGSGFKDE